MSGKMFFVWNSLTWFERTPQWVTTRQAVIDEASADGPTCGDGGRRMQLCTRRMRRPRCRSRDHVRVGVGDKTPRDAHTLVAGSGHRATDTSAPVAHADIEQINIWIPYLPIKQLGRRRLRSSPKSQSQDGGLPELLLS